MTKTLLKAKHKKTMNILEDDIQEILVANIFSLKNKVREKRKLWSSGRALVLGSQSGGCGEIPVQC